jgi:hypothetical protein
MSARKDVYLDEGMLGWFERTARKEHWRMAAWYELKDLVQDGYVCYCKCRNAYALQDPKPGHPSLNTDNPTREQRRHFMALVKTTYYNHIMTLASKFSVVVEEATPATSLPGERGGSLEELLPPQAEEASLFLALANAPAELKDMVERLVRDGLDGGDYLRTHLCRDGNRIRRMRQAVRETTAEYWERVLGTPDLPQKLAAYLRA